MSLDGMGAHDQSFIWPSNITNRTQAGKETLDTMPEPTSDSEHDGYSDIAELPKEDKIYGPQLPSGHLPGPFCHPVIHWMVEHSW